MKFSSIFLFSSLLLMSLTSLAQGPTITSDIPIMGVAVQFPLIQNGPEIEDINYSIYIGT